MSDTNRDSHDYLNRLAEITESDQLFECIRDLAENGLDTDRFAPGEPRPGRQAVTKYLATWFHYHAKNDEAGWDWLIDYSQDVLSRISSSSRGQIRHSTKSLIKFVVREGVPFICLAGHNWLKLRCDVRCPLYDAQLQLYKDSREGEDREKSPSAIQDDIIRKFLKDKRATDFELKKKEEAKQEELKRQLKLERKLRRQKKSDIYGEQYRQALDIIEEKLASGELPRQILKALQDGNFKSITGRPWTSAILNGVCRQLRDKKNDSRDKR